MDNIELQKRIMRKVCWTCYLKRAINPFMVKLYTLTVISISIATSISIPNVIKNTVAINNPSTLYSFYISAFTNTEIIVQTLLVGGVVFAIWLLKDLVVPRVRFV